MILCCFTYLSEPVGLVLTLCHIHSVKKPKRSRYRASTALKTSKAVSHSQAPTSSRDFIRRPTSFLSPVVEKDIP